MYEYNSSEIMLLVVTVLPYWQAMGYACSKAPVSGMETFWIGGQQNSRNSKKQNRLFCHPWLPHITTI